MRLIGIDPGSNTLGVAVYIIDDNFSITSIKSFVINTTAIEADTKASKLSRKLLYTRKTLKTIFGEADDIIGLSLEAPFIYGTRPAAVIPLAAMKGIIEELILYRNPRVLLRAISPSVVKKSIGVHGNSGDKEDILRALKEVQEITSKIDVDVLTDHEWDAITIGYELLNYLRNNPYVML